MDFLDIIPKMKKAYPVIFQKNSIIIGSFGRNIKLNDPTGAVKVAFNEMNGENTIADIANSVIKKFPQFSKSDIYELFNDLNSERFIEDASLIGSDVLDEYSLNRYHRNINFFSSFLDLKENQYAVQQKIREAKIGILGLGGLGSHIVYDLAGIGVENFKAVEFDKVELSNLNRQILYNYEDIGESKAQKAKERITSFNPRVNFEVVENKVQSSSDIEDAFNDVDLIILVADRPKYLMGNWANEAAVNLNVPLFAAGIEAQRAIYHTIIPHETGCAICWQKNVQKNDPISDLVLKEKRRLNLVGDNTAISPLVSAATGLLVTEVIRYITGIGELQAAGKEMTMDFLTMRTKISEVWELADTCPVCGGKEYVDAVNAHQV